MRDFHFDSNILIDAFNGIEAARLEIKRSSRPWISRISWIEVMTNAPGAAAEDTEYFLSNFSIVELDEEVARRAARLRSERRSLKLPDAVILASAQLRGRILVTRNTRDFPAHLPGVRIPYTL